MSFEDAQHHHGHTIQHCRSCNAPVIWVKNLVTGKPAPIDAEPIETGNIVLVGGGYVLYTKEQLEKMPGSPAMKILHLNHFATCPQSRSWKQSGYHSDKRKKQEVE